MTTTDDKKKERCKIATLVTLFLMSLAFIISYVIYNNMLDERLVSITQVCSEDDEGFDTLYDTNTVETVNWVYNLTNPLQYLQDGSEAHFHELGGYAYSVDATRDNARFDGDKVKYTLYTSGHFSSEKSASGLAATDEVYTMNVAYLSVLGRARHEGVLMLQATCSLSQLGLIGNTAFSVCRTEEIGTTTLCQCCSPTPLVNSTTCSDITSPSSNAGGLISYLAQHDGGVQLDSNPSAFALSSGAHTPLVVKKTVDNVILGTPSALLGTFQYQGATSDFVRADLANTTSDIVDACSVLDYCPTLTALMGQIAAVQSGGVPAILGVLKA